MYTENNNEQIFVLSIQVKIVDYLYLLIIGLSNTIHTFYLGIVSSTIIYYYYIQWKIVPIENND